MDAVLTVVTSDEPPVQLEASRAVLAGGAKVFADMLCLPPQTSERIEALDLELEDNSVTVSESEEVFNAFLRILEGEALDPLRVSTWEAVARAGDKYDSGIVRQRARQRVWELEAKNSLPLHAFTLASIVDDAELLERTARRAVAIEARSKEPFGASESWKGRLDAFEAQSKAHAFTLFRHLCHALRGLPICDCDASYIKCKKTPKAAMDAVARWLESVGIATPTAQLITYLDEQMYENKASWDSCVYDKIDASFSEGDTRWVKDAPTFASVCRTL